LAPDFNLLAMECFELSAERDIWLYDLNRRSAVRFTTDPSDDADPVWSPDGRVLVFASSRRGPVDVFAKSVGGATPEELLFETSGPTPTMAWSRDGRYLATGRDGVGDIQLFDMTDRGPPQPMVATPFRDLEPQFAPGGRFFSYTSDESGRYEVYVQPWPQTGERWQASTEGATDARWSLDGRELYFLSSDRTLMSVNIDPGPPFRAGRPTPLFQTRIAGPLGSGHRFPYAVGKDGQFLMYVWAAEARPEALTVIVNWQAMLK
jgi:Tol biopolymer transport system component